MNNFVASWHLLSHLTCCHKIL